SIPHCNLGDAEQLKAALRIEAHRLALPLRPLAAGGQEQERGGTRRGGGRGRGKGEKENAGEGTRLHPPPPITGGPPVCTGPHFQIPELLTVNKKAIMFAAIT